MLTLTTVCVSATGTVYYTLQLDGSISSSEAAKDLTRRLEEAEVYTYIMNLMVLTVSVEDSQTVEDVYFNG